MHCSLFLPCVLSDSENNESIPSAVQKNTFPQVLIPLSHLFLLLILAWLVSCRKLVNGGGLDQFGDWDTRDVLLKLTVPCRKEGIFPPLTKFPFEAKSIFLFASRKMRKLNYTLSSEMIRLVAKLIF